MAIKVVTFCTILCIYHCWLPSATLIWIHSDRSSKTKTNCSYCGDKWEKSPTHLYLSQNRRWQKLSWCGQCWKCIRCTGHCSKQAADVRLIRFGIMLAGNRMFPFYEFKSQCNNCCFSIHSTNIGSANCILPINYTSDFLFLFCYSTAALLVTGNSICACPNLLFSFLMMFSFHSVWVIYEHL